LERLHVVLVNPEIPPNTGNIARLCAATGSALHLVHPLGFSTDDHHLKRAGLDYWPYVEVHNHQSLGEALRASGDGPILYYSARTGRPYDQAPYLPGARLVFGPETRGLSATLLEANRETCFRIPIWGRVRSLNLSTAVGIVVYEGYRRLGGWSGEG
jgi:tRNA (cytidine/uridine-2'-O-)-methyltransferase